MPDDILTEHKPLMRTTITLIFPNLGPSTINQQVAKVIEEAMKCEARETFVTIRPEDEEDE